MQAALTRYRIIAWIVGVVLIALVVVGMPLKYAGGNDAVVAAVGPAHGFLFMVYIVATFDLGRRAHWPLGRMLLIMLAGTVPFLSFYAERKVTTWIQRGQSDKSEKSESGHAVKAGNRPRS